MVGPRDLIKENEAKMYFLVKHGQQQHLCCVKLNMIWIGRFVLNEENWNRKMSRNPLWLMPTRFPLNILRVRVDERAFVLWLFEFVCVFRFYRKRMFITESWVSDEDRPALNSISRFNCSKKRIFH